MHIAVENELNERSVCGFVCSKVQTMTFHQLSGLQLHGGFDMNEILLAYFNLCVKCNVERFFDLNRTAFKWNGIAPYTR